MASAVRPSVVLGERGGVMCTCTSRCPSTSRLNRSGSMRCHAVGMPRTLTEHPSTSAPVLRTVTRKLAVAPGCTSTSDWSS